MNLKKKSLFLSLGICLFAFCVQAGPINETSVTGSQAATSGNAAFTCTSDSDCNNKGTCVVATGKCACVSGYTEQNCSYQQNQQLAAFLLHFFLGGVMGSGHFYAGNVGIGLGELALFTGSSLLYNSGKAASVLTDGVSGGFRSKIGGLGLIGVFTWWLVDTIRFGRNDINDGHDKPLEAW